MNDIELAALTAVVESGTRKPGYGVRFQPDYRAEDALRNELIRRGLIEAPGQEGGMSAPTGDDPREALIARRDGLRVVIPQQCFREQRHMDEETPESAYWHYGYYVALCDVLRLLGACGACADGLDGRASNHTCEIGDEA